MKYIIIILLCIASSFCNSQTGYRIKQLANVNQHPPYSALWGYTATNGREYAILGCYDGTAFIDVTDSLNIHEVDFLPTPTPGDPGNNWREMKTYSHYAYIVSEAFQSCIQIVDMQYLPDSVRYVGKFIISNHSSTHSISQSGNFLYLNGANFDFADGIAIVDVSNPEQPVLRGRWNEYYVHDSRIINDTIWSCNISDDRVTIINALNKDSLVTIRSWLHNPAPNNPHNIAFSSNRNFAYVTDETTAPLPGKLKVWDVSDLDNIIYIRSFNDYPFEKGVVHNVETVGNYAILAYYSTGVKVLNLSNPSDPVEIGWFDTYPEHNNSTYNGCWGVYMFSSGKIIASDRTRGLFVLRPALSNPVSQHPSVNFSVSSIQINKFDSLRLIDASDGIPTSWQWTVTGPENKTSVLKNPQFTFNTIGDYSAKLKAANSFGSDSILKVNAFKVIPATLSNFVTVSPAGSPVTILTSPADTGRILFSWRKSSQDTSVNYKVYLRKPQNSAEKYFLSGNNGRDTFSLITKSFLDTVALQFGLAGDSVVLIYKAKAYNEIDSLASTNSIVMVLKRNTVGIQAVSSTIPTEFNLKNNYPNPFNPFTTIAFDIPEYSHVNLKLYDISGKETAVLIDSQLEAGEYKYNFNAGQLPSGVYFYKLQASDNTGEKFVMTKKMLLIK